MRFSLILPPAPAVEDSEAAPAADPTFDDESPTERFSRDELPVWDVVDAAQA
jgi:hypothetical protein